MAVVPSSPNPTSTSASPPDVDNLESGVPLDHPDAEYLESDDEEAFATKSDSEDLIETQVVKEPKKAK